MDDILDDLARCAARCERAARIFEEPPISLTCERLLDTVQEIGAAWSGSWLGNHSHAYTADLQPPGDGEAFDAEWGFAPSYANPNNMKLWLIFDYQTIEDEILARADVPDLEAIKDAAKLAKQAFERTQQELMPNLDAFLSLHQDANLSDLRKKIELLPSHVDQQYLLKGMAPKGGITRDPLAMAQTAQGIKPPRHIFFKTWLNEQQSYGAMAGKMADLASYGSRYLQQKFKLKGNTVAKTDGKIFIGHGRSAVWKDLKDFVKDNLELDYDEFNREPTAGLGTTERLEAMLDGASFGFLVMTAEDEHADDTLHARENVVHEVGLFQGRLGFRRAIVLLEEGCQEFSNIVGLGQIRFPKGNIMAKSEEIRRVLKREGILK